MTECAVNQDENKLYGREQVIEIINSVLSKVQSPDDVSKDVLLSELDELHRVIVETVEAFSGTLPGDIKGKHIPTATDELEAVLGATEEATGTIMDSCEAIQAKLDGMDASLAAAVEEEVTKIFEACSFQDITGQRISKVVKAIREIDEKVEHMMSVIGGGRSAPAATDEKAVGGDEGLLNGPQLPENAVSQEDIDKILAEFDN